MTRIIGIFAFTTALLAGCYESYVAVADADWDVFHPAEDGRGDAMDHGADAEADADADADDVGPPCVPAAETCNGRDDDCDGATDENAVDAATFYVDADADGWGDCARPLLACAPPVGYVAGCRDCNDHNPGINPGAAEIEGDGIDQNCDGSDGAVLVYVVERGIGILWALDRSTGEAVWSSDGFGAMIGVARADDGRLYVSRLDAGAVAEVAPDGSSWRDVLTGLSGGPHALSWDPARQTVLVAGWWDGMVHEYDPATGTAVVLVDTIPTPRGAVRFPVDDVVYVTSSGVSGWQGEAYAFHESDDSVSLLAELATVPGTLIPDGTGGLYVSGDGGEIYRLDPATLALEVFSEPDFSNPQGLCPDPLGQGILVSEHNGGRMHLYNPNTREISPFSEVPETPWQCTSTLRSDADGDGAYTTLIGGTDCVDTDPTIHPGATDVPGDGVDQDCDGEDG